MRTTLVRVIGRTRWVIIVVGGLAVGLMVWAAGLGNVASGVAALLAVAFGLLSMTHVHRVWNGLSRITEQQRTLDASVAQVRLLLTRVDTSNDRLEQRVAGLEGRIELLRNQQESLSTLLATSNTSIASLGAEVSAIRTAAKESSSGVDLAMSDLSSQLEANVQNLSNLRAEYLALKNEYLGLWQLEWDLHGSLLERAEFQWKQTQGLQSLLTTLNPRLPLPTMVGHDVPADVLSGLVGRVIAAEASVIVEFGSGPSTIVLGLALQRVGKGQVYSFEEDLSRLATTRGLLEDHQLSDWVSLVHAPLTEIEMEGRAWLWYGISEDDLPKDIDTVLVTGPAAVEGSTRYPVLPLLEDLILPGGTLLLNDVARERERETVEHWLEARPDFDVQWVASEKGLAILTKRPTN